MKKKRSLTKPSFSIQTDSNKPGKELNSVDGSEKDIIDFFDRTYQMLEATKNEVAAIHSLNKTNRIEEAKNLLDASKNDNSKLKSIQKKYADLFERVGIQIDFEKSLKDLANSPQRKSKMLPNRRNWLPVH